MTVELKIPVVGESITEVELGEWLKAEGDSVKKDENVVSLESEKATVELPAPAAGTLSKILKRKGDKAAVGETIGFIDPASVVAETGETPTVPPIQTPVPGEPPAAAAPAPAESVPPEPVPPEPPTRPQRRERVMAKARPMALAEERLALDEAEEVVPMTPLRKAVARRLVEARQTMAILTTFNEIDMTNVIELRKQFQELYVKKFEIKLGYMSFFVRAAVEGLKQIPLLNASVRGEDIVFHKRFDIGIAVSGPKGLVVPVLKNAGALSFADTERAIADFGKRAQENKLKPDELQEGTFTISNGGVFGSLLSTPIISPPQSGVLGMHSILERPIAINGAVAIRPMMYVALSYDHRIVDGREAVTFLKRVKELVENPARILLEV